MNKSTKGFAFFRIIYLFRSYLPTAHVSILLFSSENICGTRLCEWGSPRDLNSLVFVRRKAWQQLHKNSASNIEQILEATPHKIATIRPPTTHHKNDQS